MNRYTGTPVNCIWASVFVAFLLGLLAFAGPITINAIFSLSIIGQCLAFSIPIAARFLGGQPFRKGPLSFGAFVRGILVHSVAENAESDARSDRVFPSALSPSSGRPLALFWSLSPHLRTRHRQT